MCDDEISKAVQDISGKVADLAKTKEDALIRKVVDERISLWEKRRVAVILIVAAVIGITSWATLKEKVANYFVSEVITKIEPFVLVFELSTYC